jgi:hypothetical protein
MTRAPPEVFISYSHDTARHQERVLDLADRLRADGIDAEIDQYNDAPPEGWPRWCERQIEAADFVLLVCTETYHLRVKGDEKPGTGRGVVWEAVIIRQLLYDAGAVSTKFVPVLFSDASDEQIPTPIKGWTYYYVDTEDGYDSLYRRLSGQPRTSRPKLGTIRPLPTRQRRWSEGRVETLSSPAPEPPHAAEIAEAGVTRMRTLWQFLRRESNRQVLGLLGGGLVALVAGAWAVFVFLFPPETGRDAHPVSTVESQGGVAAGRDINARDITVEGAPEKKSRP